MTEELKVALWTVFIVPTFLAANYLWAMTCPAEVSAFINLFPDSVSQYGLLGCILFVFSYLFPCAIAYGLGFRSGLRH